MFPTQSKAHRLSPMWLLPLIALSMLLVGYLLFAASTAQAQNGPNPAGKYCVEGIVIDWEEKPLGGWVVELSGPDFTEPLTKTSSTKDSDKGKFKFDDPVGPAGLYTAELSFDGQDEGWAAVTPASFDFPINVGEKECVKIRFKVRYEIPVTVYKIDANHNYLADWKIKAVPGKGNIFAEVHEEETDVNGTAVFTLTPGSWIFVEHPPTPDKGDVRETYMPVLPPGAQQELTLTRDHTAASNLAVYFKNELVTGCIAVRKIALPENPNLPNGEGDISAPYPAGGWGIKLLRTDGSVARMGFTNAIGEVRFDGLPLGRYMLVEELRPGWGPDSYEALDVYVTGNHCQVDEAGNYIEPIEFYNYQDESGFCIEGRKIDANGGYPIPNWEMTIKPLDKGGYDHKDEPFSNLTNKTTTNGRGVFTFTFPRNDYRIPGALFEVCEDDDVDGWNPVTPTCQTVRLPEWPGACVQLKDFVNEQVRHGEKHDGTCSDYHVVKPGEGVISIAKKYNVPTAQLLNANPAVKSHPHQWVIIGQKLCIP